MHIVSIKTFMNKFENFVEHFLSKKIFFHKNQIFNCVSNFFGKKSNNKDQLKNLIQELIRFNYLKNSR